VTAFARAFVMTGGEAPGWFQAMLAEIHEGLRFLGIDATLVQPEAAEATFSAPIEAPFFVVDGNHGVYFPTPTPKFSFMVDHPCWHAEELARGFPEVERLGWVDASHVPAAQALGLRYRSSFVAHAGPDPVAAPLPMHERDIDVFVAGTLRERTDRARWREEHSTAPEVLAHLIFDTAERMERSLEPVLPIFLRVCAAHGVNVGEAFSRPAFCAIISDILALAEGNRRYDLLTSLPRDLRVVVAGRQLPASLRDRPNLDFCSHVASFDEIRRHMGRSKIVVNAHAKYPSGSHERIWYAMAENALVLTDQSTFVGRDFADGDSIRYLPLGPISAEHLADLRGLCADHAALQARVDRAREIYRHRHTWKQRSRLILEAMQA
jgi:hypothetical protein